MRGKVTAKSMFIMTATVINNFEKLPKSMRRRLDRHQWEEVAETAAAVHAFAQELREAVPSAEDLL